MLHPHFWPSWHLPDEAGASTPILPLALSAVWVQPPLWSVWHSVPGTTSFHLAAAGRGWALRLSRSCGHQLEKSRALASLVPRPGQFCWRPLRGRGGPAPPCRDGRSGHHLPLPEGSERGLPGGVLGARPGERVQGPGNSGAWLEQGKCDQTTVPKVMSPSVGSLTREADFSWRFWSVLVDSLDTSSGQVGDKRSTHGLLEETPTAVFPRVLQPSGSSLHPFALLRAVFCSLCCAVSSEF